MIYETVDTRRVEDLEPYNLTQKSKQDRQDNKKKNTEQNQDQDNKMFKTVPKLHYQFDNSVEDLKMYMRVGISMQIFTFVLMFVIYLILIRNFLK